MKLIIVPFDKIGQDLIVELFAKGFVPSEIADAIGSSESAVRMILKRKLKRYGRTA